MMRSTQLRCPAPVPKVTKAKHPRKQGALGRWWSPQFQKPTTPLQVQEGMPPVLNFLGRIRYKQAVIANCRSNGEDPDEKMLKEFELKKSHLFEFLAAMWFVWWFVRPLLLVPLFIISGWTFPAALLDGHGDELLNKKTSERNQFFGLASPDSIVENMEHPGRFVVLDGPRGTGKSTALKLASRKQYLAVYLQVHSDAPTDSQYILYYFGQRFGMSEAQTRLSLRWLHWFRGRPVKVFIDVETDKVDLQELTRHAKALAVDDGMVSVAIACDDAEGRIWDDPRMTRFATGELSIEESRRFLEHAAPDPRTVPNEILQHYPRTILNLQRTLLPKLEQGDEVAQPYVKDELAKTVSLVEATFGTCEDIKSVLHEAAKPRGVLHWDRDIERKCGKSFKFKDKEEEFVKQAVHSKQLFRRRSSNGRGFEAQFDQTREALRIVALKQHPAWRCILLGV